MSEECQTCKRTKCAKCNERLAYLDNLMEEEEEDERTWKERRESLINSMATWGVIAALTYFLSEFFQKKL